jgi:hypothetical protein
MSWQDWIKQETVDWLLEADEPGVRYLALHDLIGLSREDEELRLASRAARNQGPIATILDHMHEEGYWENPGPGYNPKYISTAWSVILLAQLGAAAREDLCMERACHYLVEHALAPGGQFSTSNAPSGTIDCLQGNLCWALMELGYEHPKLDAAYNWMARTVTGEGIEPVENKRASVRYYAYKCGPSFTCGANNQQACAWGGIKVMLAFSKLPETRRTPLITRAILQGAEFLLNGDPVKANYPNGLSDKPSQNWWKFGFPVFYVTDLLQNVEALVHLGYGSDPRLANSLQYIAEKQDAAGRWLLEYDYNGKTWVDFGKKKQPNKWVTLRALRVLKMAQAE